MPGRSVRFTVRLREGVHDAILERLKKVPKRGKSDYIRRVLEGASVEALDQALEDNETTDSLDGMWLGDWDLDDEE
jgi:hypothetical protein